MRRGGNHEASSKPCCGHPGTLCSGPPVIGSASVVRTEGPEGRHVHDRVVVVETGGLPPVCEFPVSIKVTTAQPVEGRTTLPNGLIIVTGPAVATVTNLSSGESATF